jgi:hypothetical protein
MQALSYTNCGSFSSAGSGVGDITYSTCYSNGYFVATFLSPTASITGLRVSGALGVSQGNVTGGPLGQIGNFFRCDATPLLYAPIGC